MGLRLELLSVSKSYGGRPALRGCDYRFEPDRVYSVMGPNGSGKSTLLRVCALLEPPEEGAVEYIEGGNVLSNGGMALKRRITLVLPKAAVFNETVFKNAAYGLAVRGVAKDAVKSRVDSMLHRVGLSGKSALNALSLSSGEARRLALARAMVVEPDVLFLDEPTAFVDEENTKIIEEIILSVKRQRKRTIVLATHDRAQAERLSDEALFMRDGRLLGG